VRRRMFAIAAVLLLLLLTWVWMGRPPERPGPERPRTKEPQVEVEVAVAEVSEALATEPVATVIPTAPTRPVEPARPPPEPKGSVLGRVTVGPDPPPRRPILLPDGKESLTEDAIVDRKRRLQGAFVYVKRGLDGHRLPPPAIPAFLDVVGYRFDPHVLGVRAGQELRITGFDPHVHLPRTISFDNPGEAAVPPWRGTFRRKEIMMKVVCDVHPWESAWIGVVDHPFFAVTSDEGLYGLPEMPAGRYTIETWHERYASVARTVDVPAGDRVAVDFFLDARK